MQFTLTDLELIQLEERFRIAARDGGSGDFRLDSPIEIEIGDGRKAADAIAELLARREREKLTDRFRTALERIAGTLDLRGIDWVIVGGESGNRARPMHPNWARSIRDQCQAANVPFFFKQWGEWGPCGFTNGRDSESQFHRFVDGQHIERVGKHAAGRLLDGREWNELPEGAK